MKSILLILSICIGFSLYSQTYTETFSFKSKIITLKSVTEDGKFKISLEKDGSENVDFSLKPMKLETFKVALKDKLPFLFPATTSESVTPAELSEPAFQIIISSLFFNIVADNLKEALSESPESGKLKIHQSAELYEGYNNGVAESAKKQIVIKDVQIEFAEGFIETIIVVGEVDNVRIAFTNKYGIGFSTRGNYANLNKIALYDDSKKTNKYILMGDLLTYEPTIKLSRRDYSPADQVISTFGGQSTVLHKEETARLLEAIVYSDFIGVLSEKPNGLIQTEVAKRINTSPRRYQTNRYIPISKGHGYLQYVRPYVVLSKIEEKNKFLMPYNNDTIMKNISGRDSTFKSRNYITPLQVINYQNFSAGVDFNLMFFDNPELKYNIFFNVGVRYSRTSIRDSLSRFDTTSHKIVKTGFVNDYGVGFINIYPELIFQLLPEERFSILFKEQINYYIAADKTPKIQTFDSNDKIASTTNLWLNVFEAQAYFKTSPNAKVFGRFKFVSELGHITNNYISVQLGYSFYLLKKN